MASRCLQGFDSIAGFWIVLGVLASFLLLLDLYKLHVHVWVSTLPYPYTRFQALFIRRGGHVMSVSQPQRKAYGNVMASFHQQQTAKN